MTVNVCACVMYGLWRHFVNVFEVMYGLWRHFVNVFEVNLANTRVFSRRTTNKIK